MHFDETRVGAIFTLQVGGTSCLMLSAQFTLGCELQKTWQATPASVLEVIHSPHGQLPERISGVWLPSQEV